MDTGKMQQLELDLDAETLRMHWYPVMDGTAMRWVCDKYEFGVVSQPDTHGRFSRWHIFCRDGRHELVHGFDLANEAIDVIESQS